MFYGIIGLQMSNYPILNLLSKFLLFTFIVVGVFGLLLSTSKDIHIGKVQCAVGQTTNGQCPNVVEHISQWENAFLASFSDFTSAILLFLSLFIILGSLVGEWMRIRHDTTFTHQFSFENESQSFFLAQLSDGILQPIR